MRLLAKGVPDGGLWAHGKFWPRDKAVEVDVSDEEALAILGDINIVALEMPEAQAKQHKRV